MVTQLFKFSIWFTDNVLHTNFKFCQTTRDKIDFAEISITYFRMTLYFFVQFDGKEAYNKSDFSANERNYYFKNISGINLTFVNIKNGSIKKTFE